jgi:hypothetical protein
MRIDLPRHHQAEVAPAIVTEETLAEQDDIFILN